MKPRSMKHASAFLGLLAIAATANVAEEALAQSLPVTFSKLVDRLTPSWMENQKSTSALLAEKGMRLSAPIFVRIYKEESELEIWKLKDGRFQHFRTYPICAWSGALGPKLKVGDKQTPEGFYTVSRRQMNPNSHYHLAFNIGFPNAYDFANRRKWLRRYGARRLQIGWRFAMTDPLIEDIYALAREAFAGGQAYFHVHIMPFRMTAANMASHRDSPWYQFWLRLKEGYDLFEATGKPPIVKVCGKQYMVNVSFSGLAANPGPSDPCPVYAKIDPAKLPGIDGAACHGACQPAQASAQWHTEPVTADVPASRQARKPPRRLRLPHLPYPSEPQRARTSPRLLLRIRL